MKKDIKKFYYNRGVNDKLDREFEQAISIECVKLGVHHIFWKKNFHWYVVAVESIERAYRRVEEVKSKVCCGPANFDIEKLMLVLKDGELMEIRIGDGVKQAAELLYSELRRQHPQLQYGKI